MARARFCWPEPRPRPNPLGPGQLFLAGPGRSPSFKKLAWARANWIGPGPFAQFQKFGPGPGQIFFCGPGPTVLDYFTVGGCTMGQDIEHVLEKYAVTAQRPKPFKLGQLDRARANFF